MKKISVSHGELELIKVLWHSDKPLPLTKIIELVQVENDWSKTTIATMLDRLLKKGAVERSGNRRSYLFSPALDEGECKAEAVERLTGQFFNGSLGSMLNFFADEKKFTPDDILEIKKLIEKLESSNEQQ